MNKEILKNTVTEASRKHYPEFKRITGGFEDRGILNSEMLAVCSLAEELGVEVFIESGRWLGQSTEILARYFENKPIIIESVEAYWDKNAEHVEKKLAGKKNLHLLYGDANFVIPRLVKKHKDKKIAILFDGPKGKSAIDIFRFTLTQSDAVLAGFFHDMRKPTVEMSNSSRGEMENIFPDSFYTDDTDFVKEFGTLDQGCDIALWSPYSIDGKKIGSYGPTIGLTIPTDVERNRARQEKMALKWRMGKRILFMLGVKSYHALRRFFEL